MMAGNRKTLLTSGRERFVYAVLLIFTAVWCLLVFLPSLLRDAPGTAFLIRAFFSPLCHQLEDRSFSIAGKSLAVCARCIGIYLGFLAGLLSIPFLPGRLLSHFRPLLFAGIGLLAVEWSMEIFGFLHIGNTLRALLSSSAGAIAALITFRGVIELTGGHASFMQSRLRKTYG